MLDPFILASNYNKVSFICKKEMKQNYLANTFSEVGKCIYVDRDDKNKKISVLN